MGLPRNFHRSANEHIRTYLVCDCVSVCVRLCVFFNCCVGFEPFYGFLGCSADSIGQLLGCIALASIWASSGLLGASAEPVGLNACGPSTNNYHLPTNPPILQSPALAHEQEVETPSSHCPKASAQTAVPYLDSRGINLGFLVAVDFWNFQQTN